MKGHTPAPGTSSPPSGAVCSREREHKADCSSPIRSVPLSRPSLDTISDLSTYSLESLSAVRPSARSGEPRVDGTRLASRSPAVADRTWRGKLRRGWGRQKGAVLIVLSQFFAAGMATTARYLETTGHDGAEPMNTIQVRRTGRAAVGDGG